MSVAYEHRSFIHEGSYPPIGDENDPTDDRFTDAEVAEHLSRFTEAEMLEDHRSMMDDAHDALTDDTRLDLSAPGFSSPIQITIGTPTMSDGMPESNDQSPSRLHSGAPSPPLSGKIKTIPKPSRAVVKHADGKFHCPLDDCTEDMRAFSRRCEWKSVQPLKTR